jgi:hypothetical protein
METGGLMRIFIQSFTGEFPRVHETRLKDDAAARAENVSFMSGTLKPMFKVADYKNLAALPNGSVTKEVYRFRIDDGAFWLQFGSDVDVILSPIKDDQHHRIYWTGDSRGGGVPLFAKGVDAVNGNEPFPTVFRKLGIPAPTNIPTIISSTPVTDDTQSDEVRFYVFTYINDLGEESAPSNPSGQIIVPRAGTEVRLGNLQVDAGASDRGVTAFRIYRTSVGTSGNANWQYVGQIGVGSTEFLDNFMSEELDEILVTGNWDAPRPDMKGLGLTAYGVAYGFSGKIVCLSEPFIIYAFPRDYELTTQHNIVAMGHYDANIIIATEGNPVVVTGVSPNTGMTMTELPLNESCVSKSSLVSLGYGVIYASPNGLVLASNNGAQIISEGFFDRDEWNALNPKSIHAVEYKGRYLFFYRVNDENKGAFIFDPKDLSSGIVRLNVWCESAHRDVKTDEIYLLQNNGKLQYFDLNTRNGREKYLWRSKQFRADGNGCRMLAMRVIADSYRDLNVKIIADGKEFYRKDAVTDKPFRLPNHSAKSYWQIEINSTDEVREIVLAETMREVMNG